MTVRVLGRSPSHARPERLGTTNDDAAYDLLTSAVWYIDAESPGAQGVTVPNLGTGGSALDATYGSTSGADTNDPLLLTHTGTSYLYLSGVAGNSVSCTAPASAVSYAAYPVGGGAATTGAATGGAAFTFSTAGSWLHVDLLNGSAEVVASFDATALTTGAATGRTDAYAVAWTINRSTSGRKTVCVVAPVWLLGTDDYLEVADNALIRFNASDDLTMFAAYRIWNTKTAAQPILVKDNSASTASVGWSLETGSRVAAVVISDGTIEATANDATSVSFASGALTTSAGVRDAGSTITTYVNGVGGTPVADTTGDLTNTGIPLNVGKYAAASTYIDGMEFFAAAVFRRALSAGEIALVTAYFNARVGV